MRKYQIAPLVKNHFSLGVLMILSNAKKINLHNSVAECALSLRKENAHKYQNYSIKDCIASIVASKT